MLRASQNRMRLGDRRWRFFCWAYAHPVLGVAVYTLILAPIALFFWAINGGGAFGDSIGGLMLALGPLCYPFVALRVRRVDRAGSGPD